MHRRLKEANSFRLKDVLSKRLAKWVADDPVPLAMAAEKLFLDNCKKVAPCVATTWLRTVCDGWCCARRFGRNEPCPFCGLENGDALRHICRCPAVQPWFRQTTKGVFGQLDFKVFAGLLLGCA